MIKILHIVHALTRGGGLSNFVMNYYRNIDREKIQFDFIYFKEVESDFKDEITELGGHYYKMTQPSRNLKFLKERKEFFKAHQGEYTALHCHALFAVSFYASTAKKYGTENIIAHAHTNSYGSGTLRHIRNYFLVKSAKHKATHYMACSKDAAIFMFGETMVDNGKVNIINNAIECKKYCYNKTIRNELRNDLKIPLETFVVGHVGGFSLAKNHIFLIDVFNEICKTRPISILLLVGGVSTVAGSSVECVKEKIAEYGLEEKIKFLGIRNDVNRLMMAMDAFVFPSLFEGFGLVLVEAQASGLPSFASNYTPNAAKCTELLSFVELEKGANYWAKQILANCCIDEFKRKIDIEDFSNYNIDNQKQILENIYLKMN